MYLVIDVGGSKTLAAVFDSKGNIQHQQKFPTPREFPRFKSKINELYQSWRAENNPRAAGIAIPGIVDRAQAAIVVTPKLPWEPQSLKNLLPLPIVAENDANAAALAEARLGAGQGFSKVLYITISTGVGMGVVADGQLDRDFNDSEGGHMYLKQNGQPIHLEELVSGSALKKRFNKFGYEIQDPKIWQTYAHDLAIAVVNMVMMVRPDVVILGGGVAVHFDKFINFLREYATEIYDEPFELPPIKQAEHPETAVIYGLYLLAKNIK